MRQSVRWGLGALLLISLEPAARGQAPPAPAPAPAGQPRAAGAGAAPRAVAPPRRDPRLDEVLATANGDKITRGEVLNYLGHLRIEPGQEKQLYKYAVDALVNTKLLNQFLAAQKITVAPKDVDAQFAEVLKELKEIHGNNLEAALSQNGITEAFIRDDIEQRLRWRNYLLTRATDPELSRFIERNKDVFSRAQVRASHIFLTADADAPAAEKQKVKQKLLDIKKDIDAGKLTFADAANKFSEDEQAKVNQNGGDLGAFERKGILPEPFVAAAFALKPGVVSDPIETDPGYSLILVTERKEGNPVNIASVLKQYKENIISQYGLDLQSQIIADRRKTAKITTKPQPADILPPATIGPAAPAQGGAAAPKAAR